MKRVLPILALLVQSVGLAVALTWPLVPSFFERAIGRDDTDTPKHLWTLWWMRHEVWDGTPGLTTRWTNFPDGMPLYPIEPLNGVFAALLPIEPVPLSNLLALLHVVLLGACAGWLGREVAGTRIGAHVASALAQVCAFTAFSLEVGVGELRQSWWIPLGLAILVRARRTEAPRWFVALAVVMAGAVVACFYHGLFLALAVSVWALCTLRLRRALLLRYALAAGLALLLALPVVRGFAGSYGSDAGADPAAASFSIDRYTGASVSVEQLFTPSTRDGSRRRYDGGRYLGLVTLALAAIGVAAAPRRAGPWVAVFGVSLVLSLGQVLVWRQAPVLVGGMNLGLPLAPLNDLLARVGEPLNFPARFLAPGMVALAVLGALATRWRLALLLVPLAAADTLLNDESPWPRDTTALPDMSALAGAGGSGAVADLGIVATPEPAMRNRAIAAQLVLARPMSAVPIERLSAWSSSGDRWLRALPIVRTLATLTTGAPVPADADWRADLWLLRDRGFDRLLLAHRATGIDFRTKDLLTAACGPPVEAPQATLWTVPEVQAGEAEVSRWRAEQVDRVHQ